MTAAIDPEIEKALADLNIKLPEPIELPPEAFEKLPPIDYSNADTILETTAERAAIAATATGNPKDAIGDTKPDLSLVPPAASLYLAAAFADGAAKYGAYNWRENAVKARVYVAAALRHINQYLDGENIDPTSGRPHIGHALACLAIIADATETGNLIDNRPLPGAAGRLIRG